MGGPSGDTSTSTGLGQNVSCLLIYLFGWVGGLIFFFIEKKNQYVRFNAMQSIVLSGLYVAASIVLSILTTILVSIVGFLGLIFSLIQLVLGLGLLVLVIILIIKTWKGEWVKLPIIGSYAAKWSKVEPPVA